MGPASYILKFSEIDHDSIALAGGKGANLGEMYQASFPVPTGFVVTASAYKKFIEENGLSSQIRDILKSAGIVGHRKVAPEHFQSASEKIIKLLLKSKMPQEIAQEIVQSYGKRGLFKKQPLVAVRSSATAEDLPDASFAGQQATFLNIRGEAQLLQAVKDCWASLFTPRAIFYREEKGFNHFKVYIAVVVQEMVQSEISGIAFTNDPRTSDKHKMVVEAVWGLGEYAVQGTVTPDRYELERHSLEIQKIDKHEQKVQLIRKGAKTKEEKVPGNRQNRQKLSEDKIKELGRILQRIHAHYYFPQDIEWAYNKGAFYVIQVRPITTLSSGSSNVQSPNSNEAGKQTTGEAILIGQGASPGIATGKVKILHSPKEIGKVKKGDVLVARMTSPDYVPAMKQAGAIVTDEGGVTSHAAIVSRELGLPCIVGTKLATKNLKDGDIVTVNGKTGEVYRGKPEKAQLVSKVASRQVVQDKADPAIRTATKIYVNLAEPERAHEVSLLPVSGVGLLRAEFMVAQIGVHPRHLIAQRRQKEFVDKLASGLTTFCQEFDPRPIVYRATDFKTNEYRNLDGGKAYEPQEPNPMLGYRGAYRYISDPDVFELELAAIKKVRETYKNLNMMIPFVRSPEELLQVKRIMAASGLVRGPSFKLWLMVELPVNVVLIEDYIKVGIDGVSIGSNDLTMLMLGTDRDNSEVASAFNELSPAVLWALEHTIKACNKHGITSSICGQAASSHDDLVEFLVKLGITSVSVNPDSVGRVQRIVQECEKHV
ncbi:MAG: phosphoenolpyruvate synthase [Candidatus Blackburnbacteria bacterium]|nr:phosphoenolpyruvate synthase [Candidatus Blackburnbacteria bacterium]